MKVLLICGGMSSEHDVSRMSCSNIKKMMPDHYETETMGIDKQGHFYRLSQEITDYTKDNWLDNAILIHDIQSFFKQFNCVFPVLHGLYGEDGTIQGLLEFLNIPYVGCRVNDSSNAMDKVVAKKIFHAAGIKQTPSFYVHKRYDGTFEVIREDMTTTTDIIAEVQKTFGFPVFVKASRSGSSVGCYKVNNEDDFLSKLEDAGRYDGKILVEKAIQATELEVAVLGNDDLIVSRVGQILPHGEFYTYDSKYNDEESQTCIPARISDDQTNYIRETAYKAFKAIDGHGLARVDFFLDNQTNEIYLNEINTMPGFTNISMYPSLMNDQGISTQELIDKLIELAFER